MLALNNLDLKKPKDKAHVHKYNDAGFLQFAKVYKKISNVYKNVNTLSSLLVNLIQNYG